MRTPALDRTLARMRADAEIALQHPDYSQRLKAEFSMEVLPVYMELMNKTAAAASAKPSETSDAVYAMTIASSMLCCNIVQNLVGMLSPTLGVSRDAAFEQVMGVLLPLLRKTHRMQLAALDNLERSEFRNGQEVEFDFRTQLKTKGEDHAQK